MYIIIFHEINNAQTADFALFCLALFLPRPALPFWVAFCRNPFWFKVDFLGWFDLAFVDFDGPGLSDLVCWWEGPLDCAEFLFLSLLIFNLKGEYEFVSHVELIARNCVQFSLGMILKWKKDCQTVNKFTKDIFSSCIFFQLNNPLKKSIPRLCTGQGSAALHMQDTEIFFDNFHFHK